MTDEQHHIARQAAARDDPRLCRDSGDMTAAQDEAPERIWLQEPVGLDYERSWCAEPQSDYDTPYVRADLARPSQAWDERAARIAMDALDDIAAGRGMFGIDPAADLEWAMRRAGEALAALAAMDTPKGGGE